MVNDDDFEPMVSSFYGLRGAPIQAGGMKILPASMHEFGADILAARYDATECDAFIGLIDVWVYDDAVLKSRAFTWWTPIDHDPVPPMIADKLQHVAYPWAMSKHGFVQMRKMGLNPRYVPHGVNTDQFKPIDRKKARDSFSFLNDDDFFIVSVAANKGKEDRKNLRVMLHAFARLVKDHPECKFYIHTMPTVVHDGINLEFLVKQLGIENHVFFPDMLKLVEGMYQHPYLNALYNAADVFLLPSAGEGFGIPVIEAQSAGCPVIVNDFTAQGELVGAGFKIQIDSDDLEYSVYGSYRARVRVSKVLTALKLSIEWKDDLSVRQMAREFVVRDYDYRHVWKTYMKPALIGQIEGRRAIKADREARTAKRLAMRGISEADTKEFDVASVMAGD
jgi:glycosyltransferase involved in cell wall biosynthesis